MEPGQESVAISETTTDTQSHEVNVLEVPDESHDSNNDASSKNATESSTEEPASILDIRTSRQYARELATMLKKREEIFDDLAINLETIFDNMREIGDDVEVSIENGGYSQKRVDMINFVQKEVKKITDLEFENVRLKDLLEDHQFALELVMNKYRQQEEQIKLAKKIGKIPNEFSQTTEVIHEELISNLSAKVKEMAFVMARAEKIDQNAEKFLKAQDESIQALRNDNRNLRKLLFDQVISHLL